MTDAERDTKKEKCPRWSARRRGVCVGIGVLGGVQDVRMSRDEEIG